MRVLVLSLLAIITGFWMSAAAEEAEIKAPAPDWVVEQPISNMPDDRANSIRDGIGFLLTDTQKKWDGDGYDYYDRMVYEITERTGLEAAARITPSFDPEDTTLAFSRLDISKSNFQCGIRGLYFLLTPSQNHRLNYFCLHQFSIVMKGI